MDEMFVVLNEKSVPLSVDSNPWGDENECLFNGFPETFTVFTLKEAKRILAQSKVAADSYKMTKTWEIKKWKIVTLDEYLRENSNIVCFHRGAESEQSMVVC